VVNGTRYISVITYVYWKNSRSGEGYWLVTEMEKGVADQFLYLTAGLQAIGNSKLENWTYNSPFPWRETPSVECYPDPGIMLAHWTTSGSNIGRALVLNRAGVTALQNIGGSNARFCTTKFAPGGDKQSSIEYTFWPYSVTKTTSSGLQLKYWTVIFDMRSSGPGFGNYGQNEMWKKRVHLRANVPQKNTPPQSSNRKTS
jgi:hypothetical protein